MRRRPGWGLHVAAAAALSTSLASPRASRADEVQAAAAAGKTDIEEVSLDDLLNLETEIASRHVQPLRESPGVVTVIMREDIERMGARDLLDVLMTVPGFTAPGVDVQGVIDVGFRGVWGHEGKILLLVDGLEMNEHLYSTLQLGQHYPLANVERIEIIRGPGSAIHGGYAELAVINIVTRDGRSLAGGFARFDYGQLGDTFGRGVMSLGFGQPLGDDGELNASATMGKAIRSNRTFTDIYGDAYDLDGEGAIEPTTVNLGATWRGLAVRALYDHYVVESRDGYDAILARGSRVHFETLAASAEYALQLGQVTITPRLVFKRDVPWRTTDKTSALFYAKSNQRLTGGVTATYDLTPALSALAGVEAYVDHARLESSFEGGLQARFNGDQTAVSYADVAGYGQALYASPIANLAVGARVEHHGEVGTSFVPRAALTKVLGRAHFKLLASRAFRAPGIENISLFAPNPGHPDDDGIRPEQTTVYEAELGYSLTDHVFASANLFDLTIEHPIVYFYDEATDTEGYTNFQRTGSRGGELEARAVHGRGSATLSYSYYHEAGKNDIAAYAVPADGALLLGMPAHKLVARGNVALGAGLELAPSAIWLSDRYAFTHLDDGGAAVQDNLGASLLVDLFLRWRDLGVSGLDVGVGIKNLTNDDFRFAQPYDGGHAPYPGLDRELQVRVHYESELD